MQVASHFGLHLMLSSSLFSLALSRSLSCFLHCTSKARPKHELSLGLGFYSFYIIILRTATMAMAAHGGSMAPAMIYQEVKNWIAQQEAFEAQHNKPAPLTDVQRMALQALRLPSASSSPPPLATAEEPNYIGMLNGKSSPGSLP